MFGLATKKDIKHIEDKVKTSFTERDNKIIKLDGDINRLNDIIAKLEIHILLSANKSEPKSELNSGIKSEPNFNNFERVMVRKAIKSRPQALKNAILELINEDMTTSQIFNKIVVEKRLISKTQFYHYLSLVRNELRTKLRTEVRNEPNRTKLNK